MVSELRWVLLLLSVPLLVGIWWWTSRRSAQRAPGNAELRESTIAAEPRRADSDDDAAHVPLSIRASAFDQVPVLDGPMMVIDPPSAPPPAPPPMSAIAEVAAPVKDAPPVAEAPAPAAPAVASPRAAPAANTAELQRIVTIRVCTQGEDRWPGAQLMAALELRGLAFGRYQVFHRNHPDGRSLFCVASLVEPGTFDIAEMPGQTFRGITLFAVLPGPADPVGTVDELLETAHGLAEELAGIVQDGKGMLMSQQRAAAIREDVARFAAGLQLH